MSNKEKNDSLKFESQFSIYKVDYDQSCDYFINQRQIEISSQDELVDQIIEDIKDKINMRTKKEIEEINNLGFKGLLFKTHHSPTWKNVVRALRGNEEDINVKTYIKDVENTHISYVLLYKKNKNIFILTAGLGSGYISEFTQKNYGLYLVPKILKENSAVVRAVAENRLLGNQASSTHANRNVTDIGTEKDMSTIFRELALEINKEVIEILGMSVGDKKRDNILTINARDSFVIRKSMPIENIKKVLDQLVEIEKREDNFSMGYLINVQKYKYPTKKLNTILINNIVEKNIEGIIITHDDYYNYYVKGEKYIIKDQDGQIVMEQDHPIKISDIYDMFPAITKSKVEYILKCQLEVFGSGVCNINSIPLKKCIQAIVEDEEGKSFFLYNGNWLMFDKSYIENLNEDFKKVYNEILISDGPIVNIIKNKLKKETEDDYNVTFEESDEIILAHTVEIDKIEIADLIYYDQENLYLIHNKTKFQGGGARDVFDQIVLSAKYITNSTNTNRLGEYYKKIKEKYPNNKKIQELSEKEFIKLFKNRNIHYIAGFMKHLSANSRSNSAKYMVVTSNKTIIDQKCKLHLYDIG